MDSALIPSAGNEKLLGVNITDNFKIESVNSRILLSQVTKYFVVDIKGAEWDKTGQDDLPGSAEKLPAVLHSYLQCFEYKYDKQATMNGPQGFYPGVVLMEILKWNSYKYQQ